MTITIHNTLTRSRMPLAPLEPGHVRIYVCGVTVYDFCHMGNGRTLVAFDVVVRWLRARGYRVTYVRNITDVDDKIIKRAAERGITPIRTGRRVHAPHAGRPRRARLHRRRTTSRAPPSTSRRCSASSTCWRAAGLAYQADDGDVDYAVRSFPRYGRLSGKSLDDLRAGERVAVDEQQARSARLRAVEARQAGRAAVAVALGAGPSRLAHRVLGDGERTARPALRHPRRRARPESSRTTRTRSRRARVRSASRSPNSGCTAARCASATRRCRSRSATSGPSATRLPGIDGEVLRCFLLRSHYRSQVSFSEEHVGEARAGLPRLYTALRDAPPAAGEVDWSEPNAQRFRAAMDDDFNTAEAVGVLFALANEVNRSKSPELARQLKGLGGVLGLLQTEPAAFLQGRIEGRLERTLDDVTLKAEGRVGPSQEQIEILIAQRASAKRAKNFAEADRIRAELAEQGIVLEDSATGTTWRRQ